MLKCRFPKVLTDNYSSFAKLLVLCLACRDKAEDINIPSPTHHEAWECLVVSCSTLKTAEFTGLFIESSLLGGISIHGGFLLQWSSLARPQPPPPYPSLIEEAELFRVPLSLLTFQTA